MIDSVYFVAIPGPGILPSHAVELRLGFNEYAYGIVVPDCLRPRSFVLAKGTPLYASKVDALLGRNPVATSQGQHSTGVGPPPGCHSVPPWRNEW